MSQETLNLHTLKMCFFLLHIVETSFGNTYTKFQCLRTSDNEINWLKIFKYFF